MLICFSILILWTMCGKAMRGRQKAMFCWFLFFVSALMSGEWGMVGWGRKSYLWAAEIASFSSRDFSRGSRLTHSDMLYQLDISNFHFYEPLPFQIFFSGKFLKLLGLSSCTITFTVRNHGDNIFICFTYYTVWNQFSLKNTR